LLRRPHPLDQAVGKLGRGIVSFSGIVERLLDLVGRGGKTHVAHADLHAAQRGLHVDRQQRVLVVALDIEDALTGVAAADDLVADHGEHEQHAEAGGEAEFPADTQIADLANSKHGYFTYAACGASAPRSAPSLTETERRWLRSMSAIMPLSIVTR